jgi:glycosyltransferase involved in cell wall biosynthesis
MVPRKNTISLQKEKNARLVSIVTVTYNRRKFFLKLIRSIEEQTYPKEDLEWIIIDDGTDKIEDLVKHLPYVKYHYLSSKMNLGCKRNYSNEKAKGNYIIYFDDDDYHQPTRIQHSVDTLKANPSALIAASSKMLMYYTDDQSLYTTHEFHGQHGTAGTFCFRKQLLNVTKFDNKAKCSEEKYFLKDYKISMVQLDYKQTIVIMSHDANTFDKRQLKGTEAIEKCEERLEDIIPEWYLE